MQASADAAATHATAAHAPKATSESLAHYVGSMLAVAPANFAAFRGTQRDRDVYQIRYNVRGARAKSCYKCVIADEFAWPQHAENWYFEDEWTAPKTMAHAKVVAYVNTQLNPLLKGYTRKKTGSDEYPKIVWNNGAKGLWVTADVFNGGFTMRVGHSLPKAAHQLLPPNAQDVAALRNAITNFITLGIGPASQNFATLRSNPHKSILGTPDYDLSVTFGSLLRNCSISDASENTMGLDDYSPKWTMECQTVPMFGTVAQIEPQINSAIAAALPSGFSATTGKLLGIDDYRYDNVDTQVMADVDSFAGFSLPHGLVSFGVGIIHFLPKPPPTASPTP
jgi:hypothetical protein